ncbi:hypothetical protein GIY30_09685 [Gordonia sp. HNM0687]|uniref:Uncharacterized protein n=1 Tax=Gordonia mangrovi TaxID=2665643 RepID=A0A6L7GSX0_9ACTN|nr:hypothetical protein [Gordonia mangrovi]MXP21618.1 hypothetical protein [Gordonia mangrovi]UVF80360.1 hypothetical protein NWF22_11280 [Gordonia mangrovi]
MGDPTGTPPRSAPPPTPAPADDLYRAPLYGQLYPPLGYAPDGTPLFVPGQPTAAGSRPTGPCDAAPGAPQAPGTDDEPAGEPAPSPRPATDRRLVGLVALVAVAALGLLALTVGRAALRGDEPVTQPTLPMVISELPTRPPTAAPGAPTQPGAPGVPGQPAGREVTYEVTASSPATILYVDDVGLRTTVGASAAWTITFTGSANPLRVLVLAGAGEAGCTISVDGRVVAEDRITADSPRRTVSCRA